MNVKSFVAGALLSLAVGACLPEPKSPGKPRPVAMAATPAAPAAPVAPGGADLPQGAADAGPRGDAARGAIVYEKTCKACHQADGSGMNGMLAANLAKDRTRLAKPDSLLLDHITNGFKGEKLEMPAQGKALKPDEIKDALAYVRKTFGK